jgi:acetyl-CoA acetyltransferase
MTHPIRGKISIVGVGEAGLGKSPKKAPLELLAEATLCALDDAGVSLADVDGLCAGTFYHFFPTLSVAEYLGIRPKWSDADMIGGASFMSHVMQASLALMAGLCDVVLVAYGSNARSSRDSNGLIEIPEFEAAYDPPIPITGYALAASRHMHEYGTTREHLAHVAVAARQWAQLNPAATSRDPLTIDDVLSSPMIAEPLTRHDCCLISDGGAALILTRSDHAKSLRKPPVHFLGGAGAHWHREIAQMPDLTVTAASESGPRAFAMAGIGTSDVDVLQVYDAFTINTILLLEDLGFCDKGQGGAFVAEGHIAPGGKLPVNTSGGGLSFVHPGMFGLFCLIETVRQLRGEAGDRQIDGAQIGVAHGNGGTLSSQFTTVFGTQETL